MRIVLGLILAATVSTPLTGAETSEIPLDTIWGLDIPGTRDIEGIDLNISAQKSAQGWELEDYKRYRRTGVERVRQALAAKPPSADALTGFVVTLPKGGAVIDLLYRIDGVLAHEGSDERGNIIGPGRDVFLVFYSHPSSYFLRLKRVERQGNTINVTYAYEPHYTVESTAHLALIPLGNLESGEYQVNIVQEEMDRKYIKAGFIPVHRGLEPRYVCRSFSFKVIPIAPAPNDDPVSERIPLERIWALDMPGTRDVRELSSDDAAKIRRTLTHRTGERAKAGPCFFVTGEGEEALRNAAKVIVDGKAPAKFQSADKALSVVFYSYAAPGGVVLHSVRRSYRQITIRFQVVTHQESGITVHFAIIPLGKLSVGQVVADIVEVASETPYSNHALTNRAVCDSCTTDVKEGA